MMKKDGTEKLAGIDVAAGSGRCDVLELDLDHEEREILADLLETRLADLRMEIGRTSPQAYRDTLRKNKKVLEKTVACLRGYTTRQTGFTGGE
jgi:hypothetical protein